MSSYKSNINDCTCCKRDIQLAKKSISDAQNLFETKYTSIDWHILTSLPSSIKEEYNNIEKECEKAIFKLNNVEKYLDTLISSTQNAEQQILQKLQGINWQQKINEINNKIESNKGSSTPKVNKNSWIYKTGEKALEEKSKSKGKTKKKKKSIWSKGISGLKSGAKAVGKGAVAAGKWMIYEPADEKWEDIKGTGKKAAKAAKTKAKEFKDIYIPRAAATGCNFCSSFSFGFAKTLGETTVDSLDYVGTALLTPTTLVFDGAKKAKCKVFGGKYKSTTKELWSNTKEFVEIDFSGEAEKKYYEYYSEYDEYLKNKSYNYEGVQNAGRQSGSLAGTILVGLGAGQAVSAAGGISMSSQIAAGATTSGIIGTGTGSENAWKDGASLKQGIVTGAIQGTVDFTSYYLGAKFGTKVIGDGLGKSSKLATFAFRTGADSLDGFVNSLLPTFEQKIYKDESLGEIFKQNGGWSTVLASTFVAGGLSAANTAIDIKKGNLGNDITSAKVEETEPKVSSKVVEEPKLTINKESELNKQITKANYETDRGHFTSINIDTIDDINIKDLNKLKQPEEVLFKTKDGKILTYDQLLTEKAKKTTPEISTRKVEEPKVSARKVETEINNTVKPLDQVRKLNNPLEVSEFFGDSKQFLYKKIEYLAKTNPDNIEYSNLYRKYVETPVCYLNEKELYNSIKNNLTKEEKNIYKKIKKSNQIKLTDEEIDVINAFTKYDGPELEAALRRTETTFKGNVINGKDIENINGRLGLGFETAVMKERPQSNMIEYFKEKLDGIINKSAPLKETIIVKRGADNLYYNNNKIDVGLIKPGAIFNDEGYTSASVINTAISSRSKIEINIKIPKGTKAAYIEKYTGIRNYGQQELLLPRNSKFKITSYPEIIYDKKNTKKIKKIIVNAELII